jgi:hypothetical protein
MIFFFVQTLGEFYITAINLYSSPANATPLHIVLWRGLAFWGSIWHSGETTVSEKYGVQQYVLLGFITTPHPFRQYQAISQSPFQQDFSFLFAHISVLFEGALQRKSGSSTLNLVWLSLQPVAMLEKSCLQFGRKCKFIIIVPWCVAIFLKCSTYLPYFQVWDAGNVVRSKLHLNCSSN